MATFIILFQSSAIPGKGMQKIQINMTVGNPRLIIVLVNMKGPILAPKGDLSAPRGCPPRASDTRVSREKQTCMYQKRCDSISKVLWPSFKLFKEIEDTT
jgi:hypothetical protein